jgi:hypothetical protein
MRTLTPDSGFIERGSLYIDIVRRNIGIMLGCLNKVAARTPHDVIGAQVVFLQGNILDLRRAAKSAYWRVTHLWATPNRIQLSSRF